MAINPTFVKLSRKLRKSQTPWEKKLWSRLKNKSFGVKFKRQVVIGSYIYDFSCFEKKIIIELDGSQHASFEVSEKDKDKTSFAARLGYKVLRFYNSDIENNLEGVLENIRQISA